jgi:phosphoglycolate phosphatase
MIKAVVFDFDDTLCFTEGESFELENEIITELGLPPMDRSVHHATWGRPLMEAIRVRAPGINVDDFERLFVVKQAEWAKLGKVDTIRPEVLLMLEDFTKNGYITAIVTSRTYKEAEHLLHPDHTIQAHVKAIYHKDNTPAHKPDHRVFEPLLKDFSLDPKTVVYIGDTPTDGEAALAAGMHFIATLEAGIRLQNEFDHLEGVHFVRQLADVPAVVRQIIDNTTTITA